MALERVQPRPKKSTNLTRWMRHLGGTALMASPRPADPGGIEGVLRSDPAPHTEGAANAAGTVSGTLRETCPECGDRVATATTAVENCANQNSDD